jgi:single-stranded-DNA-specific exonuclease
LNKKLSGPKIDIREYLDLVALGTIADLVNLDIPNRILVKNGLQMLNKAKRPGIQALKEVSKLPPQGKMDTGSIGFSLAPRLNAAGRIDKPEDALELLLAKDLKRARELAQKLESLNQKRRSLENGIYKQALEQANKQKKRLGLVLYNPDWHEGVIGIVASRIAEYYNRPTLILTSDGSCLKGSGRSVAHFDLYAGLCQCSGLLQQFGGHKQAAGLKVKESKLDELRENFNLAVKNQLGTNVLAPILKLEAKIGLNWIDYNFVKELELLQPFGPGNPEPVFCSKGLMVRNCKVFRKEHISLELRDEEAGRTMFGKAWKAAEKLSLKVKGEKMQFAFTPRFNIYNGLTSIDLQIRDWRYLSSVS